MNACLRFIRLPKLWLRCMMIALVAGMFTGQPVVIAEDPTVQVWLTTAMEATISHSKAACNSLVILVLSHHRPSISMIPNKCNKWTVSSA